jgi:hypothetical protein
MERGKGQGQRRRDVSAERRTDKDPINEVLGVKGFHPGRSQSRKGRSISTSFTVLPEQDLMLSELAAKLECSRSSVVRLLLETKGRELLAG